MKYIRTITKRLKLINISIRSKLLLIYLLCVLIPTIVFSYVFYSMTMNSTRKEKLILFQQSVDRIAGSISTNAMSAIELSNIIFPDGTMYEYINKKYTDKKQCLDDYNAYMQTAWDKILPYNTNIVLFTVFTNNDTVLNGKHLKRIDNAELKSDWYGKYVKLSKSAAFISHIDEVISQTGCVKLVSYVRRLDYKRNSKYSHIIKITFQANMLDKLMRAEPLPGTVYVVDSDGHVVASNAESESTPDTEFQLFSDVPARAGSVTLESPVKFMENWRIICMLRPDFMADATSIGWTQLVVLVLSTTAFASAVIYTVSRSLYRRIILLVEHMGKVSKEEYVLIPEKKKGNDEIGLLISSMNSMIEKIRLLIEDVYKAKLRETQLELTKKQSELTALQCQVNPHFMFNVLETVRVKSFLRNEFETARIVKYMSRIFRKLLLWNDDLIAIKEEVDFIKEYLEIQQYRYEEELNFQISIDERLERLKIPKMTLQVFVDNACEHGFSESTGMKSVTVSAEVDGGEAVLIVRDNGCGMTPEQIRGIAASDSNSIGIRNVIGRLNLYYGGHYRFVIESEPGEFTEVRLALDIDELKRSGYV